MENTRQLENANKITYLVTMYPDKPMEELLPLFRLPPVDVNASIWLAQELGWLTDGLDTEGKMLIKKAPKDWQFGTIEEELEKSIAYCFGKLAKDETDLDEKFMTDWLTGYPAHDCLIAVNRLLEKRVLFEYKLTEHNKKLGDSTYKFYTLYENSEMQWGKKNFTKNTKISSEE